MSFDPSRGMYPCRACKELNCICKREHKPLDVLLFNCQKCHGKAIFYVITDLHNHIMESHPYAPHEFHDYYLNYMRKGHNESSE